MRRHTAKGRRQRAEKGSEGWGSNFGCDVFIIEVRKEHRGTQKCWLSPPFVLPS